MRIIQLELVFENFRRRIFSTKLCYEIKLCNGILKFLRKRVSFFGILVLRYSKIITIYAPLIYTAPSLMFWMRAYPLRREVGGGWALEFQSFLGPVKWHRADRGVPFGTEKT